MEWKERVCAPRAERAQRMLHPSRCSAQQKFSIGIFNFSSPTGSLQAGINRDSLGLFFKENNVYKAMVMSDNHSQGCQHSPVFHPAVRDGCWALCSQHIFSIENISMRVCRWETHYKHYCSCSLLAAILPSPFDQTGFSNTGFTNMGFTNRVYCPGLRTGLWAGFPTASAVMSSQDT